MEQYSSSLTTTLVTVTLLIGAACSDSEDSSNSGATTKGEAGSSTESSEASTAMAPTVREYLQVELGSIASQSERGNFFSTKTGQVYLASEITDEIAPDIDVAFVGEPLFRFFSSPTDESLNGSNITPLSSAMTTQFVNNAGASTVDFSMTDFDAADTKMFETLSVSSDNETLPLETPYLVLFENSAGSKGALRITNLRQDGGIVFDVKVLDN